QTGIDYDALGITFLGAMTLNATTPLSRPLGVNTSGFGNRVQPGQAVLTFQVQPDRDGSGAGALVMVNSSSVSPNGAVLSDPVPALVVDPATIVGGPPGALIAVT